MRRRTPEIISLPVGEAEIAERLKARPQTVHAWRHRGLLPPPRWRVSGRPAWEWVEIEDWARRTGRLGDARAFEDLLQLEGAGWSGDLGALRADRAHR